MGLLNYFLNKIKRKDTEARLIVVGLDNAGKTTLLRKLSGDPSISSAPTQGFNIMSLQSGSLKLNCWDIGGQKSIRPYWRNYYNNTDAVIFVMDSADRRRLDETGIELNMLLEEDKLSGVPLAIFLNKQDLITSLSPNEVIAGFNLYTIRYFSLILFIQF